MLDDLEWGQVDGELWVTSCVVADVTVHICFPFWSNSDNFVNIHSHSPCSPVLICATYDNQVSKRYDTGRSFVSLMSDVAAAYSAQKKQPISIIVRTRRDITSIFTDLDGPYPGARLNDKLNQ